MSEKASTYLCACAALGLLGLGAVFLKLFNLIAWPWWAVTAPFWVMPLLLVIVGILTLAGVLIEEMFDVFTK